MLSVSISLEYNELVWSKAMSENYFQWHTQKYSNYELMQQKYIDYERMYS